MAVRRATVEDLPELVRMGLLFADFAKLPATGEDVADTLMSLLQADSALLIVGDGAMAAALCYPLFTNRNTIVVEEMFWWVDEDKRSSGIGAQLIDAVEAWAEDKGANRIGLTASWFSPAHVGAFYEKRGYELTEMRYARIL